jgi:cysteine desulfurase
MQKIYFDHSATTPIDLRVLKAMIPYFSKKFGNASSIHSFGQEALAGVDKARQELAKFFNCESEEIIFTSGATESNNLAIRGLLKEIWKNSKEKPHIVTSLIEHDAVLEPFMHLEKSGVEVSYIPVKANGVIDLNKFEKLIKENTVFVSVMYVNSEVGSIQPIREIGKIIKKINEKKINGWKNLSVTDRGAKPQPIYFHTDATQAVNFLDCDVKKLHVDMLSMSGHKIYGPKGVGALFVKSGTPISAMQLGGHQENNLRSGTFNVPGIVGLGKAVSLLSKKNVDNNNRLIAELRDQLVDGIQNNIPDVILNTDRENSTPSHAHFSFNGVEGESSLISLDLEGVAVSTGSACASGSLKASHVLLAMGIKPEIAHSSIRFTLGRDNTKEEVRRLIKVLPAIIERFRKFNPIYKKPEK